MRRAFYAISLLLGVPLGILVVPHRVERAPETPRRVLYYVDPMHPSYTSDNPGIAPDCGMKLEPVYAEETKNAMRLLAEKARIISEGAGALPVAAALSGKAGKGPIVAIVSGGNIDLKKFCELVGASAS